MKDLFCGAQILPRVSLLHVPMSVSACTVRNCIKCDVDVTYCTLCEDGFVADEMTGECRKLRKYYNFIFIPNLFRNKVRGKKKDLYTLTFYAKILRLPIS